MPCRSAEGIVFHLRVPNKGAMLVIFTQTLSESMTILTRLSSNRLRFDLRRSVPAFNAGFPRFIKYSDE